MKPKGIKIDESIHAHLDTLARSMQGLVGRDIEDCVYNMIPRVRDIGSNVLTFDIANKIFLRKKQDRLTDKKRVDNVEHKSPIAVAA